MASTKRIVVLGATGNQGGSVIDTFLDDKAWRIRGVSRNISSARAKALEARGVEMVQADLSDPASLQVAFKDASVIFGVTDFWSIYANPDLRAQKSPDQPMNEWTYEYELRQGKNVFDAAAQVASLEMLVFSALSNPTKWSKGKYPNVLHFTSKADAVEYGKDTYPELWKKTSVLQAGWYISNFLTTPMLQPKKVDDGVYHFVSGVDGDTLLPFIAAEEDIGPATKALVQNTPGKNLIVYREQITPNRFVEIWSRALGVTAKWIKLPEGESIPGVPEDLVKELIDNWAYFNEFGYEGRDDPTLIHPHQLEPRLDQPSVESWVKKQDWSAVL
ncbi:hypothetical protein BJX76DRAFT_349463 [Aspergillus varians]